MAAENTKKGRPRGAKNQPVDQGQLLPATSCAKCGSTSRGPYFNRRDLDVAGVCVLTGKPYTSIIIRRTRCQDCGQQRDDRQLVNRPARKETSA